MQKSGIMLFFESYTMDLNNVRRIIVTILKAKLQLSTFKNVQGDCPYKIALIKSRAKLLHASISESSGCKSTNKLSTTISAPIL